MDQLKKLITKTEKNKLILYALVFFILLYTLPLAVNIGYAFMFFWLFGFVGSVILIIKQINIINELQK
jgi:uncharacterized MAPEG superfamily protein